MLNTHTPRSADNRNSSLIQTSFEHNCIASKCTVRDVTSLHRALLRQMETQPCQHVDSVSELMKDSGTHSWVSLGSWKARIGIWLMRFRLSLRICRVGPRRSRAPSSNTLILLLLRYLNTHAFVIHLTNHFMKILCRWG